MNADLRHHLDALAGPQIEPTPVVVAADLARGRQALHRRRIAQTLGGSTFAVAALIAAVSFGTGQDGAGVHSQAAADRSASTMQAARLVAYTGAQPKGFTLDKVPDGWSIQKDDTVDLLLAPNKAGDSAPTVDPSKAAIAGYGEPGYIARIDIMLESKDSHGPPYGTKVKVGDQDGVLMKSPRGGSPTRLDPIGPGGDTGWQLWVKQPSGVHLIVQFDTGVGLSQAQMIELGAGVHVHKGAGQIVG